jgi:hypothetical protein
MILPSLYSEVIDILRLGSRDPGPLLSCELFVVLFSKDFWPNAGPQRVFFFPIFVSTFYQLFNLCIYVY